MDMYARLKATVQEYVESFDRAAAQNDTKYLADACTPDCRRTYAPKSLIELAPSLAVGRSNDEFAKQEAIFFAKFASAETKAKDITIDVKLMKAVVLLSHHCVFHDGTVLDIENVAILYMNDDGTKAKKVHQYTDSLGAKRMLDMDGGRESVENAISNTA